ncbi:MAG: succinylglutamate desuccinylase/aspartoacylase family protein [Saprospiraceae bacterium]
MYEILKESKFKNVPEWYINGEIIEKNVLNTIKINVGKIPSHNRINIFAHVMDTGIPGPRILLLAGIHGNEINGIETLRRVIEDKLYLKLSKGSLIIIPLLNVYGFINYSRDVLDGKDVNRSFPGHINGSLASRIARIITKFILPEVDVAIDFHTGGEARYNYPQIRYNKNDQKALLLAQAAEVPFIIEQPLINHSFRKAAFDMHVPAIVFEGGESIRLSGKAIETGYQSIINILSKMEMMDRDMTLPRNSTILVKKTSWVRAAHAGLFIWKKQSGEFVKKGEILGHIKDPYGTFSYEVHANQNGYIIGHNNASVVYLGDALFHIGLDYSSL